MSTTLEQDVATAEAALTPGEAQAKLDEIADERTATLELRRLINQRAVVGLVDRLGLSALTARAIVVAVASARIPGMRMDY